MFDLQPSWLTDSHPEEVEKERCGGKYYLAVHFKANVNFSFGLKCESEALRRRCRKKRLPLDFAEWYF